MEFSECRALISFILGLGGIPMSDLFYNYS
jgi:hypothetical protein